MKLKNVMEDLVAEYVDEAISNDNDFCKCERCRLDVIALALNKLKPKYVVTEKGYAYARLGELQAQFRTDMIVAVKKAMDIVKKKARH
ncbi:MAG: late competence development ComFB family protein [Actinomycetota bacterium]|nr:late competence development ComFB family protein [Actinomycetota bacterium]